MSKLSCLFRVLHAIQALQSALAECREFLPYSTEFIEDALEEAESLTKEEFEDMPE